MFPPPQFFESLASQFHISQYKVKQHLGPIERGAHQASYGGVEDLAQKIQSRGYLYQNVMGEYSYTAITKKQIKKNMV